MTTWSPTSLFNRRAYGLENLRPLPQKDFCNTIGTKRTSSDVRSVVAIGRKADIAVASTEV
jgi:hypothetical protein